MAHIQIADYKTKDHQCKKWINIDLIEYVEGSTKEVVARIGKNYYTFRGPEAEAFLEAYERLCVATPRPEVG